jgi:Cft2 family RNA processing exonuclease
MTRVRLLSGSNDKGPACVLVESGGRRLLLDAGYGPDPGRRPDLSGVGPLDAVLLSHGHRDHAGALERTRALGDPPVWCTAPVAATLPPELPVRLLPLAGASEVAGLPVRTGRSGHAPGGVWLHLGLSDGALLYFGDCSLESPLYAFDAPPRAEVAVVDASYGDYDTPLEAAAQSLAELLGAAPDALLPVPPAGRGPEIAWWLSTRLGLPVQIGDDLRAALRTLCSGARASLRADRIEALARIAHAAPPLSAAPGVRLAGSADGSAGESAHWLARVVPQPHVTIVFTGYLPEATPARALTASGRARHARWNVHPRARDTVALARASGVRALLPAFGEHRRIETLREALAPARLVLEPVFEW